MAKLKCSDCGDLITRFKHTTHPVCYFCQRDKYNMRKRLILNGLKDEQLKNWACSCYNNRGFILPPDYYCCFACLDINPAFRKPNEICTEHKI